MLSVPFIQSVAVWGKTLNTSYPVKHILHCDAKWQKEAEHNYNTATVIYTQPSKLITLFSNDEAS